jgi:phosphoribosyl 1,2-cyclic phosphate phosphodiesterase
MATDAPAPADGGTGAGGIELLFLGTGTSAGVPMIGCDCETCTSADPRDNRTRCSVVIRYAAPGFGGGAASVLLDTTPELRIQALANKLRRVDALVFTHAHADHVMGLDDVRRFNALKGGPLDVWADEATHAMLSTVFAYAFREPDPGSALYRPHLVPRLIEGPFDVAGRPWTPIPLVHGDMPVLGFRVGNLAYCTDVSEIPAASLPLMRGLEVLVLDALQFRKHPTHFTIAEALDVVAELRPRTTYFTHISHNVLNARDEPTLPEGVHFAYDGLRIRARGGHE